MVRRQVDDYLDSFSVPLIPPSRDFRSQIARRSNPNETLRRRVNGKISDGDIRGAVRELASDESVAPMNDDTIRVLRSKHPPKPPDLQLPEPPDDDMAAPPVATNEAVLRALRSFKPGSAAGPDGLRADHLKKLVGAEAGEAGVRLLDTLTRFVGMVLRGGVSADITSVFFGASLCALSKKDGGIRPIAVGNTLRRLATKMGAETVAGNLGRELQPVQLGVSTRGGCEAAAHGARNYVNEAGDRRAFLKIDLANAFNCIRRDAFLSVIRNRVPSLYHLIWQCYSSDTMLLYGSEVIISETGVQQGDPLGSAIFSLGVDEIARSIECEFNVWYIDDASLADEPGLVLRELQRIIVDLEALGLSINGRKCELTLLNHTTQDQIEETVGAFRGELPGVIVVSREAASLLGAPLAVEGIPVQSRRSTRN